MTRGLNILVFNGVSRHEGFMKPAQTNSSARKSLCKMVESITLSNTPLKQAVFLKIAKRGAFEFEINRN